MPKQYLLHKTDRRVVTANAELLAMAAKPDSEWLVVDEATALKILRDKTGVAYAEFFQERQLEEAKRLLALAQSRVAGAAPAPAPAVQPVPAVSAQRDEEQARAAAALHAAGKSAKLTDSEIAVSFRDAGETAVQSSATKEQIDALPKLDPETEESAPAAPAPAPASAPAAPPAPAAPAPKPAPVPTSAATPAPVAWGKNAKKSK